MVSRRNFLKKGTLGAVAAGVSIGLTEKAAAINSSGPAAGLAAADAGARLDRAAFASQLNTTFRVKVGNRSLNVKLVEVKDLGSRGEGPNKREAFALTFRGDRQSALRQETYTIEHARLGSFSFLVVPAPPREESARYYVANINRLHG